MEKEVNKTNERRRASTREKLLGRRFSSDEKTDPESTSSNRGMKERKRENVSEGKGRTGWRVAEEESRLSGRTRKESWPCTGSGWWSVLLANTAPVYYKYVTFGIISILSPSILQQIPSHMFLNICCLCTPVRRFWSGRLLDRGLLCLLNSEACQVVPLRHFTVLSAL
jgi:hypothetical protein